MRRRLSFFVGAALLLLAAGVYSLPARLVPLLVDDSVVRLSGVTGRALNGTAARVIVATNAGPLHLGRVSWRFDPRSLLRLDPSLELRSTWGDQRLAVRLSRSGGQLRMRDLDAALDADVIRQFAPVALDGRLTLLFEDLEVSTGRLHRAQGRVVWQDAVWLAPRGVKPLGTYAGEVSSGADGSTRVELLTIAGPVIAEGFATLTPQRYSADLLLSGGDEPLDLDVSQALSLLASPVDNGYRLRLDGDLNTGI